MKFNSEKSGKKSPQFSPHVRFRMEHEVYNLFPSSVHYIHIKNFQSVKERVISYIYNERKKSKDSAVLSNRGGWQSKSNYHLHDNILQNIVSGGLSSYWDYYKKLKFRYDGLWFNINNRGHYNLMHSHAGCELSGVLWIKTPPNCGLLEFQSPHEFNGYKNLHFIDEEFKEKTYNYPTFRFNPMEGCMIIFPSYLYHHVEPNQSDEDRISLSFNINLYLP